MLLKLLITKALNMFFKSFEHKLVHDSELIDYVLHEYSSYEEYREIQIFHNKRKIDSVWADERTLDTAAELVLTEFENEDQICGLRHGTRNGFERNYLRQASQKLTVIGTDISDTASQFDNAVEWDFHKINPVWTNSQNFVYTNSLDQSWQPKVALQAWLSQLRSNGILIIEHSESHGPQNTSKMDPFGVKPTAMPYILSLWFGSQISISHSVVKTLQ